MMKNLNKVCRIFAMNPTAVGVYTEAITSEEVLNNYFFYPQNYADGWSSPGYSFDCRRVDGGEDRIRKRHRPDGR